jgi:hypothetical protein
MLVSSIERIWNLQGIELRLENNLVLINTDCLLAQGSIGEVDDLLRSPYHRSCGIGDSRDDGSRLSTIVNRIRPVKIEIKSPIGDIRIGWLKWSHLWHAYERVCRGQVLADVGLRLGGRVNGGGEGAGKLVAVLLSCDDRLQSKTAGVR